MPCPFVTLNTCRAKNVRRFAAQRLAVTLALVLTFSLFLTGCADMNPFSAPANPEAAVYSQFSDIPVPKDMSTNVGRTFVNYGQDGTKVGLETLEGRIPSLTLTRVMINNMLRDGWSIRATASGSSRYMQLFERENRYAVIYYYDQTTSYAMEIWVATRLADGAVPPPPPLDPSLAPAAAGGSSVPVYHGSEGSEGNSGMNSAPASGSNSSGGVSERSLP